MPVRSAPLRALPGRYGPCGPAAKRGDVQALAARASPNTRSRKGARRERGGRRNSARIRPRRRNPACRRASVAPGSRPGAGPWPAGGRCAAGPARSPGLSRPCSRWAKASGRPRPAAGVRQVRRYLMTHHGALGLAQRHRDRQRESGAEHRMREAVRSHVGRGAPGRRFGHQHRSLCHHAQQLLLLARARRALDAAPAAHDGIDCRAASPPRRRRPG